jgi:predicted aspartyl protease
VLLIAGCSEWDTGRCITWGTFPSERSAIEGVVNAAYEPVVTLTVQGASGPTRETEAAIDIGDTGTLTLPPAMVVDLGLSYSHMGRAFLANDAVVTFNVHAVIAL